MWIDASDTRQGPVAGSCEHGNEPSVSIRGGEFLDFLSDYQLFKKGSVPRTSSFICNSSGGCNFCIRYIVNRQQCSSDSG
jgi:hypothetical protein